MQLMTLQDWGRFQGEKVGVLKHGYPNYAQSPNFHQMFILATHT